MNRMMTAEFEAYARTSAPMWPVMSELDASREVEAALLTALKTIVEAWKREYIGFFGADDNPVFEAFPPVIEARSVIRMAETAEGYAIYKGVDPELVLGVR